jgi:hypothetical protein
MAPLHKSLNQHVRARFGGLNSTNIDQFVLDIIIPIFRLRQSLSTRAGRGYMNFHGDLHTGNIMYREGGFPHEPVLIDFGRASCTLSNGAVIGPFDGGFNVDMLTLCASLNQLLMNAFMRKYKDFDEKMLVVSPLLKNMLRFAYPLLTAKGTFNWHNLFSYNPPMEIVEHFFLYKFLDHVNKMREVEGLPPTVIKDTPPPTTYVSTDPLAFIRVGVPTVVIPLESSERTPPSSAAVHPTTSGLSSSSAAAHVSSAAPTYELTPKEEAFVSGLMVTNRSRRSRRKLRKECHNRRKTRRSRNKERN